MFKKSKIVCLVTMLLIGIVPFVTVGTNVYAAEENIIKGETIYSDEQGNVFTNNEVIVQKGLIDPRIQTRSVGASPISIGILWTYDTKADGTKLRDTFRKVATVEGAAGIAAVVTAAGISTGPIAPMLGAFAGIAAWAMHSRFTEGANEINNHPNSGKIYMYLDHVTYANR